MTTNAFYEVHVHSWQCILLDFSKKFYWNDSGIKTSMSEQENLLTL